MFRQLRNYRFQKCSDVERDFAVFELVDQEDNIIMDFSINDEKKTMEVFFHDAIAKYIVGVELLRKILEEGEQLLKNEE